MGVLNSGQMKRALLLVCFLAGCTTTAPQGEKPISALWILPEATWRASTQGGVRLQDGDKKLIATLSARRASTLVAVWQKLKATSGVDADLGIARTSRPNAFAAFIQGRPTVILGLSFVDVINDDPDALAATIGHELAHLHFRHGEATKSRNETAKGASQFLGILLSAAGVPFGGNIANLGVSAIATSYSRDQEREADIQGLDWALAAGYDACGSARTMKALQSAGNGGGFEFLSSHPGHEERIDRASKKAGKAC